MKGFLFFQGNDVALSSNLNTSRVLWNRMKQSNRVKSQLIPNIVRSKVHRPTAIQLTNYNDLNPQRHEKRSTNS